MDLYHEYDNPVLNEMAKTALEKGWIKESGKYFKSNAVLKFQEEYNGLLSLFPEIKSTELPILEEDSVYGPITKKASSNLNKLLFSDKIKSYASNSPLLMTSLEAARDKMQHDFDEDDKNETSRVFTSFWVPGLNDLKKVLFGLKKVVPLDKVSPFAMAGSKDSGKSVPGSPLPTIEGPPSVDTGKMPKGPYADTEEIKPKPPKTLVDADPSNIFPELKGSGKAAPGSPLPAMKSPPSVGTGKMPKGPYADMEKNKPDEAADDGVYANLKHTIITEAKETIEQLVSLATDLDQMGSTAEAISIDKQLRAYRTDVEDLLKQSSSELYDIFKETGESFINSAHPGGGVTIAPASDEGGKVETIVEEHKKMLDRATKAPTGKLASTFNGLVALANRLDRDGKEEAAELVDKTIRQITNESPFVGRDLVSEATNPSDIHASIKKEAFLPLVTPVLILGPLLPAVLAVEHIQSLSSVVDGLEEDLADFIKALGYFIKDKEFGELSKGVIRTLDPFTEKIVSLDDTYNRKEVLQQAKAIGELAKALRSQSRFIKSIIKDSWFGGRWAGRAKRLSGTLKSLGESIKKYDRACRLLAKQLKQEGDVSGSAGKESGGVDSKKDKSPSKASKSSDAKILSRAIAALNTLESLFQNVDAVYKIFKTEESVKKWEAWIKTSRENLKSKKDSITYNELIKLEGFVKRLRNAIKKIKKSGHLNYNMKKMALVMPDIPPELSGGDQKKKPNAGKGYRRRRKPRGNPNVTEFQKAIKLAGFGRYVGTVDGIWGKKTATAWNEFRKKLIAEGYTKASNKLADLNINAQNKKTIPGNIIDAIKWAKGYANLVKPITFNFKNNSINSDELNDLHSLYGLVDRVDPSPTTASILDKRISKRAGPGKVSLPFFYEDEKKEDKTMPGEADKKKEDPRKEKAKKFLNDLNRALNGALGRQIVMNNGNDALVRLRSQISKLFAEMSGKIVSGPGDYQNTGDIMAIINILRRNGFQFKKHPDGTITMTDPSGRSIRKNWGDFTKFVYNNYSNFGGGHSGHGGHPSGGKAGAAMKDIMSMANEIPGFNRMGNPDSFARYVTVKSSKPGYGDMRYWNAIRSLRQGFGFGNKKDDTYLQSGKETKAQRYWLGIKFVDMYQNMIGHIENRIDRYVQTGLPENMFTQVNSTLNRKKQYLEYLADQLRAMAPAKLPSIQQTTPVTKRPTAESEEAKK